MNYKQQLEVVQGLFVPPDTQVRMDCPFCHNKNTLSVDTMNDSTGWYCFHASCSAKGKKENEKGMSYVKKTFETNQEDIGRDFVIPDSFKIVDSNEKAKQYMHKNNCAEAWAWHRASIKYDVKQNRIVFLIKNQFTNKYVGAIGRGLNSNVYPKWYMYGSKDVPFKCGECEDSVIVEDCASACAVSNVLTGISIMGTSLKESHKKFLKPYKKLYVALDRDATAKSYKVVNDLRSSGFENVNVKTLKDDLKYFNTDEIKEIFYG